MKETMFSVLRHIADLPSKNRPALGVADCQKVSAVGFHA